MTQDIELAPSEDVNALGGMKKAFIKTYGCQMNVYDSERIGEALQSSGYELTDQIEGSDLVLLNTCHIREKAAEKIYSELGRIRPLKEQAKDDNRNMLIAIAGCVAQAEGEEIAKRAPVVDIIVGPQTYHRLPQMIKAADSGKTVVDTDFPVEEKFDHLPARKITKVNGNTRNAQVSAFVTVQEGCDKFCSFCVVPYTRGAEISRSVATVKDEVARLVDQGVKEFSLLGQNVNAYHGLNADGTSASLADLLNTLSQMDGVKRLRYTTSHPLDMHDDLMALHGSDPKVMPYLHLPVQSGSDRILKAMNRKHGRDIYYEIIAKLKHYCPDIALSGDFIVGFPSETDEDFEDTMQLVRDITYAQAYSFKYSPRPGTPGADRSDHIAADVASERLARLQALLEEQQAAFNQSKVGVQMNVLLEKPGRNEGQLVGKSPWLQPVHVSADSGKIGDIIPVKITSLNGYSLFGEKI